MLFAGVVVVLSAGAGVFTVDRYQDAQARERGRSLFLGGATLPGRLERDGPVLPVLATRCVNCHGESKASAAAERAAANTRLARPAAAFASRLEYAELARMNSRRGGPPSRFDATALCTLLRSGIDPAGVVLPSVMPRYEATPQQCADLWAYLAEKQ